MIKKQIEIYSVEEKQPPLKEEIILFYNDIGAIFGSVFIGNKTERINGKFEVTDKPCLKVQHTDHDAAVDKLSDFRAWCYFNVWIWNITK